MSETVKFRSGADTCVGILTMPKNVRAPVPLLIMAGGWCYTKEVVMPHYSRFFEDLNCATLRFDYRCFGESSGDPRQHIDPWSQIEDYRNALTFSETLPGIDRSKIGLWGISYSGGHVLIIAAIDPRAAFVISTIPVVDGFQTMRRCHGESAFAKLNRSIMEDRRRRFLGEPSGYMAMSTQTPADVMSAWPFPHVFEGFQKIKAEEAPRHEHRNTIESVENLTHYLVAPYCRRIVETPVLMTLAAGDNITSADLEAEAFNAIANPNKAFVSVRDIDHMSIYTNREHLGKVAAVQAKWLKDILAN
jgi:pimeloyl-ACP methyl ester carboxylesterase